MRDVNGSMLERLRQSHLKSGLLWQVITISSLGSSASGESLGVDDKRGVLCL